MAAHVNVTFTPSSAVVSTGDTVIIGGDDCSDRKVVGFSLSGITAATVTGAKNKANNCRIKIIINKDIHGNTIEKLYFNLNLTVFSFY